MNEKCPSCGHFNTVKNGFTYHAKPRCKCKDCGREFTIGRTKKNIDAPTRDLVRKLLLEKIPLAGIQRTLGVSKSWLLSFIKVEYSNIPLDMNVDSSIPTVEKYQGNNLDEFLEKLPKKK